jgi:ADP-ribose pyrophosphatase YjhB (NUDIX family)
MDTKRTMITFKQGDSKFTYRIGGIIMYGGRVLFQRATLDPEHIFWFLPGGRAEVGESATETLAREMVEELGESVQVGPLLYIIENFFTDTQKHHELGLYFAMNLSATSHLFNETKTIVREEKGIALPLIFDWLPLTQLTELNIQPRFFREALHTLPPQPMHIVLNDPHI